MIEVKSVDKPDERRDFAHGHLEVLNLSGLTFGTATFEPGWRWSESVGPIVGTRSCQVHHNGYCVSGRMRVRMDDGSEAEITAGDVFVIPAGHDAWVTGDEPFVGYDFAGGMAEYAKATSGLYPSTASSAPCGWWHDATGRTVRPFPARCGPLVRKSKSADRTRSGARLRTPDDLRGYVIQ